MIADIDDASTCWSFSKAELTALTAGNATQVILIGHEDLHNLSAIACSPLDIIGVIPGYVARSTPAAAGCGRVVVLRTTDVADFASRAKAADVVAFTATADSISVQLARSGKGKETKLSRPEAANVYATSDLAEVGGEDAVHHAALASRVLDSLPAAAELTLGKFALSPSILKALVTVATAAKTTSIEFVHRADFPVSARLQAADGTWWTFGCMPVVEGGKK